LLKLREIFGIPNLLNDMALLLLNLGKSSKILSMRAD
jgi:hypothetical protein